MPFGQDIHKISQPKTILTTNANHIARELQQISIDYDYQASLVASLDSINLSASDTPCETTPENINPCSNETSTKLKTKLVLKSIHPVTNEVEYDDSASIPFTVLINYFQRESSHQALLTLASSTERMITTMSQTMEEALYRTNAYGPGEEDLVVMSLETQSARIMHSIRILHQESNIFSPLNKQARELFLRCRSVADLYTTPSQFVRVFYNYLQK